MAGPPYVNPTPQEQEQEQEQEKVDPNAIVIFTTNVYRATHGIIGDVGCDFPGK